jgi:Flp pilus assembly protein TadG
MLSQISRVLRKKDGMAAIEFALLSPILLFMFLGGIELTDALNCRQKVAGMSATAADLVAAEIQVSNADMSNVFSAINSIVYPYPTTGLRIVISSLADDGHGHGTVTWSDAQNATARNVNSTVTVPSGVITTGGTVILAEVTYPYHSAIAHFLAPTTNMTTSFYARPRRSVSIARVP